MGERLTKAPVYFALAQIQFNAILNLSTYLPAIQTKMRKRQFSDYRPESTQRLSFPFINLGEQAGQVIPPAIVNDVRYVFGHIDGASSFLLEQNGLTFMTTAYDTFHEFLDQIVTGLRFAHEEIQFDSVDRIGIRYLNAIRPLSEGEKLSDYLIEEVLGLSQKVAGPLVHSISETVAASDAGQIMTRVLISNGQVGVPMELMALNPKINSKFLNGPSLHAILDIDSSYIRKETRIPFDLDSIEKRLVLLHDDIESSFLTIAKPHAFKIWK